MKAEYDFSRAVRNPYATRLKSQMTLRQREKMLNLRDSLLDAQESRLHGEPEYSVEEVADMMRSAIREARDESNE